MAVTEKRAPSVASSTASSKRGDASVQAMAIALQGEPTWWLFLPLEVNSATPQWTSAKGWWLQPASITIQDRAADQLKANENLFQRQTAKDSVRWEAILCWVTLRPLPDDKAGAGKRTGPVALYTLSNDEKTRLNRLYQQLLQAEEQAARAVQEAKAAAEASTHKHAPGNDAEPEAVPPNAQARSVSRTKKRRGRPRKGELTKRHLQEAQKAQKVHNRRMVEEKAGPNFVMFASVQAKKRPKIHLLALVPPAQPEGVSSYVRCSRLGAEATVLAERNVFCLSSSSVTKYDVLTQRKGWAVVIEDWAVSPVTLKLATGELLRLYQVGDHEWLNKRRELEQLVASGSKVPMVELPEPQEDPEVASVSTTASKRRHLTAAERRQREIDELSYLMAPSSSDEADARRSSSDAESDETEDEEEESSDSSAERRRARRKRALASRSRSQSVGSTASSSAPARKKPRAQQQHPTKRATKEKVGAAKVIAPPPPTSTLVSTAHRLWVPAPARPNPTLTTPMYSTAEDGAQMVTMQLPSDPPTYVTLPRSFVEGSRPGERGAGPAEKGTQRPPPAESAADNHADGQEESVDQAAFMSALLNSVQAAKSSQRVADAHSAK